MLAASASTASPLNCSTTSTLNGSLTSSLQSSPKPTVSHGHLLPYNRAASMRMHRTWSLNSSAAPSLRGKRGVQICEDANKVLEISTRSVRVERGDLELYYPDDFEPDPVIECFVCKYEAESETEAGGFRIYNLPNGGWQLLCPKCNPPDDTWEFDRTVAVSDSLLSPDLVQLIFLFLASEQTKVCAQVCRQWNELSWTTLTLCEGPSYLMRLQNGDKLRNVWVLRVFLHQAKDVPLRVRQLCDHLFYIEALAELTLTGVRGDALILLLAQALKPHRFLQVLDVGACRFQLAGLRALLGAMDDNQCVTVEFVLPRCCLDSEDHKHASVAAASNALRPLLAGTNVIATLV
eukprot:GGOE01014400.1.p1 GENE.GGOE01014400.1~~GGOE01014400.1.p1  ORF type:complete len:370 (+),score=77.24 GGOE01014400.1:65-1111(+)